MYKKNPDEHAREDAQDADARLFLQAVHALPLTGKPLRATVHSAALPEHFSTPGLFSPVLETTGASHAAPACQRLANPSGLPTDQRPAPACEIRGEPSPAEEHAQDFARAMHGVRPLRHTGRDVPRNPEPVAVSESPPPSFQTMLEHTLEFALSFSEEYIEGHVLGLDNLILQKLKTGQYSPEAHLDLHGLKARQAFDVLVAFIRRSWHRGMRTVLLIPGRGNNSPDGVAVLRERVQSWLTQDPLKRVVLAFCTARPVDGGPGSLYVLLRKYRKKGKIYWEREAFDLEL